jgi:hypothetical protein
VPKAVSSVIVNLPSGEATAVCQKEDFAFGQAVLIYAIDEFSVALGWPIDHCTMHPQRLDNRRNVARCWQNHETHPLYGRYYRLQGEATRMLCSAAFKPNATDCVIESSEIASVREMEGERMVPRPKSSKGQGSVKKSKRKAAKRVYSSADLADSVGISKMTLLRNLEEGRLARPAMFLQFHQKRVWLWNRREFRRSVDLLRASERAKRMQRLKRLLLLAEQRLGDGHKLKSDVAGIKIILKPRKRKR